MSLPYSKLSDLIAEASNEIIHPVEGIQLTLFPKLSELIGGLRPHEVTLMCAGTGVGKTELLASFAAQLLVSKVPTFVAPIETGKSDFAKRILSAFAGENLNTGAAHHEEKIKAICNKFVDILAGPLMISHHEDRVSVEEMAALLAYQSSVYGVKVSVLDNLNFFMQPTDSRNINIEMDNAIHEFVILVKKLPMHVILVVHPKKPDKNGEQRLTSEFDIKGSSTAVQESANVLLINRPAQSDLDNNLRHPNDRELTFKKIRRRGWNINKPVWLSYAHGKYGEIK
jgi:replicative DNA helicase